MGFTDRLKSLRKPKVSQPQQQESPVSSEQPSPPPRSPLERSPEGSLSELQQKLANLKATVSRPAQSPAAAQAAQQLLNDCRNLSAVLESQTDTFADEENFDLVQGVFETSEELRKISQKFDGWYNAATRTAVAHSVAVNEAPAGLPVTASQPVGDDRALSAFARQISELRTMVWDDSKPVDRCDLAIAEAKSCSEALAGRINVWLNKKESAKVEKLMQCNDELGDIEEEWKVLRMQRGPQGTSVVDGRQEEEEVGRDEREALESQREEEERLKEEAERKAREEREAIQKAQQEAKRIRQEEEAARAAAEEAEEKEKEAAARAAAEEAERKEKEEEAAARAAEEAERKEKEEAAAARAAEEAERKEKEEAAAARAAAEEADRKEKEEAARAAEEADRKEKEEAARAAAEEADRKEKEEAARAAEEADRKEKEEAARAAAEEADRKEKEEAARAAEEADRKEKEAAARAVAEEAEKRRVESAKAAEELSRRSGEQKAKRVEAPRIQSAEDGSNTPVAIGEAAVGAGERGELGTPVEAGVVVVAGRAVGRGRPPPRSNAERKEIEVRNSRILWQMREEAAKKAHQRRQEAALAESDGLLGLAIGFHKEHGGKAYQQSCLRMWSMYVRGCQHARRRLYEAASDEERAAAVDYATSISLDKPSDLKLIESCRRKLEESDRQAVLQSELKAAMKARDLATLQEVLPAIPRDKAGPEAYRVLSEERLRDAVRRKAEPAELERLITEAERSGAAMVYITPARALVEFYGARRKSDLMASVSYCAKLGVKDLPARPLERLSEAALISIAFRRWQEAVHEEATRTTVGKFFFELWRHRLWLRKEVARLAADDAVGSAELAEAMKECERLDIEGVEGDEELAEAMRRKKLLEAIYSAKNVKALVEATERCRDAGIVLEDNFMAREALGDALGMSLIPKALELEELERLIAAAKYAGVPTTYSEEVVKSRRWNASVAVFREGKEKELLRRMIVGWKEHARYSARLDSIEGRICVEHEERLEKESFIVWAAWAARWKDVNEKAAGMIRSCEEDRVRGAWEAWKTYRKNWKEKERKAAEMAAAGSREVGRLALESWRERSEGVREIVEALKSANDESSLTSALSACCYDEDLSRRAGPEAIEAAKSRLAAIRLRKAVQKGGSSPAELRDLWREAGWPETDVVGDRAWQLSVRRRALRSWAEEVMERRAVTHRVERCLKGEAEDPSLFRLRATLDLARERDVKENGVIMAAERRLAEIDLSTELSRPMPSPGALGQLLRNSWLDRNDATVRKMVEEANTIRANSVGDKVKRREARDALSIWKEFAVERVCLRRKLLKSTDVEELSKLVEELSVPGHAHGDLVLSTGAKDRLEMLEWARQQEEAKRQRFQRFQKKWEEEESRWSLRTEVSPRVWPEEDRKADYFHTTVPKIRGFATTPLKRGRVDLSSSRSITPRTTPSLSHTVYSPWGDRSLSPATSMDLTKFSLKTPSPRHEIDTSGLLGPPGSSLLRPPTSTTAIHRRDQRERDELNRQLFHQ